MERKHLTFSGMVQGVGFRYHAHMLATQLGLTGYVKNNFDGTVESEVQGEIYLIEQFLEKIKNTGHIRIEHVAMYDMPVKKDETRFSIEYY